MPVIYILKTARGETTAYAVAALSNKKTKVNLSVTLTHDSQKI